MRPGYLIRLTLAVLPLLTAGVVVGTPANAGPGEYDFVALTNSARAGAGLAPYAVAGDLSAVARGWAARMAASHSLYHNPGLYSQVSGWSAVGENIGYGGSVSVVNGLLMNSPTHRANILSRTYSQIGVGTAVASDGSLWVVEDFRLPNGASPPPAAAPPAPSYVGSAATAPRASRDRAPDPPPPPPPAGLPGAVPPPAAAVPAGPPPDPVLVLAGRLLVAGGQLPSPDLRDPLRRALDYWSTMNALADGPPSA